MDAVKFMEEYNRMCKAYGEDDCGECPLRDNNCFDVVLPPKNKNSYAKIEEIVEKWSRENPEEVGKKYIIEISRMTPIGRFQVKGTHATFTKAELDYFEEYKESEE